MPEPVDAWWHRRQRATGEPVPYPIGRYREEWRQYPVLVRQYHPDLNCGVVLSQVPPAADVYLLWQCDAGHRFVATPAEQRMRPGRSRRRSSWCPECAVLAVPGTPRAVAARPSSAPALCAKSLASRLPVGAAFVSVCAPRPASAAEPRLRQLLAERLEFAADLNAVRIARPFFRHLEVWPDIVLDELRVTIEYDTTGRDGLEHLGRREAIDRRKDRLLRAAGWEVVRVRGGALPALGPFDLHASSVTGRLAGRVVDRLREVRGDLIVNSYLR